MGYSQDEINKQGVSSSYRAYLLLGNFISLFENPFVGTWGYAPIGRRIYRGTENQRPSKIVDPYNLESKFKPPSCDELRRFEREVINRLIANQAPNPITN